MTEMPPLVPVILSGGSGTRLWPVSTAARPKQFIALTGHRSMFALTLARTAGLADCQPPIIVANASHRTLIEAEAPATARLMLEPCARNTAPAIALAALAAGADDPLLLVMPADHAIADVLAFHRAVALARPLAAQGWLVTFGIEPDGPETGYGYIALGDGIGPGAQRVARFIEKPDRDRAQAMLEAGNHVWNAGIFLFRASAFLDALAAFEPAMLAAARSALAKAQEDAQVTIPGAEAFAASPANSIDFAVMERADKVACVPVSMGWSDVGSWDALFALGAKDGAGNAVSGPALAIESHGCLVRSDGPDVTLVGVDDLIVVATGDAVLVMRRGHSQDVRKAVAVLAEKGASG